MSKEVVKKQENKVAAFDPNQIDSIFENYQVDVSDIVIPKVLLMQPSSQFVGDQKAQIGEFRHSISGEKIGSIVEPFEIIPFYSRKSWDIVNADANNEFMRNESFTPENANLPWSDKEGAVNIKRIKRLDFFCMVPKLMEKGSELPAVISFKSTGYRQGSIILTEWEETRIRNMRAKEEMRMSDMKLPFSKSFIIEGNKLQNEKKQTYCVPIVRPGVEVSVEVQKLCLKWLNTVKTSKNIIVDDSDTKETTPAGEQTPGATGEF